MTKVVGIGGEKVETASDDTIKNHIATAIKPVLEQCQGLEIGNVTIVVEAKGYAPMCAVSKGGNVIGTIGALEYVKTALTKIVS
jgi:hypothetical protein